MKKDNGLLSAKEIHDLKCKNCDTMFKNCGTNGYLSCCPECDHFKKQYLDFDLFVWRKEQYKKYLHRPKNFKKDFPNTKKYLFLELNNMMHDYNFWLFEFVMNGKMDKEMKK